ncbi:MAG: MmgE/PrpD family protein [Pseudorhodobacter sp.]
MRKIKDMTPMFDKLGPALARFALEERPGSPGDFYVTSFMNWYAVTLAGARRGVVDTLCRFHAADGAQGNCQPLGRDERLPATATVGVDCLSSAALAYDDIHFETTLHPAGPVAAAIMGIARRQRVSGVAALQALRVGMEIECRLSAAMFNAGTGAANGWYPTGMAGGFGAAAAAGRLLGLDEGAMQAALALAACRASGIRGAHGAMSAYWPPAIAAEAGYAAALMADQGFTGSISALSGPNGLLRQVAAKPDLPAALDGLGQNHICESTAPKLYPYGFIAYAPIDCAMRLAKAAAAQGTSVATAVLSVSPTCARLGGHDLPANMFEAQVALRYIVARMLGDPAIAYTPVPDDFTIDPADAARAGLVEVRADPDLGNHQCVLQAHFANGDELVISCDAAPGSVENPLPSGTIADKAQRLLITLHGEIAAAELMARLKALSDLEDLSVLL